MKKIILIIIFSLLLLPVKAQWIQQNSGTTENLNDVFAITADTVVVVGNAGTILRTTDGGNNWQPIANATANILHKVKFINTTTGYIVGDNGTLLKTTDAGETWQTINLNITNNLYDISCPNDHTIYISGSNGLIKKSIDSGQNWTTIPSGVTDDIHFIAFEDNQTGFFVAISSFYKTNDGGNNWLEILNMGGNCMEISQNIVYLGGFNNYFKSTNTGNSFNTHNINYVGVVNSIKKIDNVLWMTIYSTVISSSGTYILKSIDNENNFTECFLDAIFIHSSSFYNNSIGYAIGEYGVIYKNSTGINTVTSSINNFENIFSIYPNPNKGIFNIKFDKNPSQNWQYQITNLQGQILMNDQQLIDRKIDASWLPAGVYLLNLQNDEKIFTQKIIIQK